MDTLKQRGSINHYYMTTPEGCTDPRLVGREMSRLEREYNKAGREIDRLDKEIFRLRRKYNLSLH